MERRGRFPLGAGLVVPVLLALALGGGCSAADVGDPARSGTVGAVAAQRLARGGEFMAPPVVDTYGPHASQVLEVYAPVAGGDRGVIVWFPGGGYAGCDPRTVRGDAGVLRQRARGWGIVVACYRVRGWDGDPSTVLFPSPQLDGAAVVTKVRNEGAQRWGLNPRRVVVAGHSAAGNLAGLLGVAANATVGPLAGRLPAVDGWISVSGELDIDRTIEVPRKVAENLLGRSAALDTTASVSTYVDPTDPPGYLIHGDQDAWAPHSLAERVKRADTAGRIRYDLVDVDRRGESLGALRGHLPLAGAAAAPLDAFLDGIAR